MTPLEPVHRPTGDPCACGRPWRHRTHLCPLCGSACCEHAVEFEPVDPLPIVA